MALVQSLIVAGYLEGVASELATDKFLSLGFMPVGGEPMYYSGNTVEIAAIGAPGTPTMMNRGSGGGNAPVAMADQTETATVRTTIPSTKISVTRQQDLDRNNGMGQSAESFIKTHLKRQSLIAYRIDAMAALASTTLEHDISEEDAPDDKISRDALILARDKFGDEMDGIIGWVAHSAKISEMESLINANGVPYFPRDPSSGYLMVLGYPVYPMDTGTLSSGVYSTYLIKKDCVHFGREDVEATGPSVDKLIRETYVPTASGVEGYTIYEMFVHYDMHLFAKYAGGTKPGVVKLLSH